MFTTEMLKKAHASARKQMAEDAKGKTAVPKTLTYRKALGIALKGCYILAREVPAPVRTELPEGMCYGFQVIEPRRHAWQDR
jgi:hypothetical protein